MCTNVPSAPLYVGGSTGCRLKKRNIFAQRLNDYCQNSPGRVQRSFQHAGHTFRDRLLFRLQLQLTMKFQSTYWWTCCFFQRKQWNSALQCMHCSVFCTNPRKLFIIVHLNSIDVRNFSGGCTMYMYSIKETWCTWRQTIRVAIISSLSIILFY